MQKLYIMMFLVSFNMSTVFSSNFSGQPLDDEKDKLYLEGQKYIATIIASEKSKMCPAFISIHRMCFKHSAAKRRSN